MILEGVLTATINLESGDYYEWVKHIETEYCGDTFKPEDHMLRSAREWSKQLHNDKRSVIYHEHPQDNTVTSISTSRIVDMSICYSYNVKDEFYDKPI